MGVNTIGVRISYQVYQKVMDLSEQRNVAAYHIINSMLSSFIAEEKALNMVGENIFNKYKNIMEKVNNKTVIRMEKSFYVPKPFRDNFNKIAKRYKLKTWEFFSFLVYRYGDEI